MESTVYKTVEVVGTSTQSIEEAIKNAIHKTAETVRHLDWFEVTETRGFIENQKVKAYQVCLKIGLRVE
jgi:flavin-binding protein dodecin